MTALVQINQGTAPAGTDGDTVRAAFAKVNSNTAALAAQVPLVTTYVAANTTLDTTYVGKRVGVNSTATGGFVYLPKASTVALDGCILLWNINAAVTIGLQGADGTEVSILNTGDWILYASDGNSYWHVVQRGRNLWNETVGGNLAVGGALSVGGVTGNLVASGKVGGSGNQNLVLNGSAEFGLTGWAGAFLANPNDSSGASGSSFYSPALTGSTVLQTSANIPVTAGVALTLSAVMSTGALTAGKFSLRLEAFSSAATSLGYLCISQLSPLVGWTYKYATGTTPANTAYVKVEFYCDGSPQGPAYAADIQQIKLELGTVPSLYSQEASIAYLQSLISVLQGAPSFTGRPTFAGATPWDSANLVGPMTLAGAQVVTGSKTFSGTTAFSGTVNALGSFGATYTTNQLNVAGAGLSGIGFNSGGVGAQIVLDTGSAAFQLRNFNSTTLTALQCTTVTQSSDLALKTNISDESGVLDKLRNKRTVSYVFKADDNKVRHFGVIAQEWQEDFPELVTEVGADIDADGDFIAHQYDEGGVEIFGPNGKPESRRALGFNYSNASAVALQAAIELQERLEAALARIAALEAKQS